MRPVKYFLQNPTQILLGLLNRFGTWLPDKPFLKLKFRLEMGYPLNLKNPKTFQEKLQWLKLYNRKPEYTTMVDKVAAKDYVAQKIGKKYIIPTICVWNSTDEIELNALPDKFVLKTSHGGGSGGVVICRNKAKFDFEAAKKKLDKSVKSDIFRYYREWPYKDVPRRIIAEKYLEIPDKDDLTDYKIYCFKGDPRYIQVIQDRNTKETIDFFDTDWNHQEFYGLNPIARPASRAIARPASRAIARPANLSDMLNIARRLSKDIPFVRVDLYQTAEGVYFGETTFYPASGLGTFTPEAWNNRLGDLINIDNMLKPISGGRGM